MNGVIQVDIVNLENKITWISPKISLGTKMAHNKTLFMHIHELGKVIEGQQYNYIVSSTKNNHNFL